MTQQVNQPFEVPDYWFGPIDTLTDDELVHAFADGQVLVQSLADGQGRLEQELQHRAAARGATTSNPTARGTVIQGKGAHYIITTKDEYDRTQLSGILELFEPEGKGKSFVPAHMEEVPHKWDMQQVHKYAKQAGKEALTIVEAAKFPGKASGKLVQT